MARRLQIAGMALFALSGVFYMVSGVRASDWWVIIGSVLWLVGVGLFTTALVNPD
ncbi:MAG: hypothetical protein ACE5GC_02580 [Acidimicrobiia bacterium]